MNEIFFSYSRSDSEFVGQMADELQARGVDVWVDTGEILAGEAWRHSIVEAIRNCKVFIIVLSPNSVASENVTKELTLAEQYDKRVLPLVIENVEIPPGLDYQLAGLQHQTFAEGEYEDNFERLVRALIATGIKVQPKSETSVDEVSDILPSEEPIKKIGLSKGFPISTTSQALKMTESENPLKKIPIWLWVIGAFVIALGLVVLLMNMINGDKREQPTSTLETLIAVVPIEDDTHANPYKNTNKNTNG